MTDRDQLAYGDLESVMSRDVPVIEARRRTDGYVPPGLLHALEMRPDTTRVNSSFVRRGIEHDTIVTRSSPLHTPTSAVVAADAGTSFTFGAQRGAPQGQGQVRDACGQADFGVISVQRVMYDDLRHDEDTACDNSGRTQTVTCGISRAG